MIWMLSQHVVVGGLLAVLVGIVCRLFALSPATRHTLWLIVLLKVLLPLPVTWPWGIPTPSVLFAKPVSIPTPAAPATGVPSIQIPRMPQDLVTTVDGAAAQTAPVAMEAKASWISSVWASLDASRAAGLLWVLLSVAIIGGQLINHAQFRRRMRSHTGTPEWLAAGVIDIAHRLGIDPPDMHVVDGAPSPCVYGLRKTKLIIPEAMLEAVPRERWDCILTHELAHLKRRDHWVRWFELATGGIWFWNPMYWIARRHMRANAELACDAWVVWALPDQRRVYAETLIDVSELIAKSPQPIAALGMGARGVRLDFERRLKMILHERNAQRMTWKAGACAALLAVIAMPGWSQNQSTPVKTFVEEPAKAPVPPAAVPQADNSEDFSEVEKALQSPVNIQFAGQHVTKIMDFIGEYLGINIVVDQGAVKPDIYKGIQWGVDSVKDRTYTTDGMLKSVDVKATKGNEVLDEWVKQLNLTYKNVEGMIFISSAKQMQEDEGTFLANRIRPVDMELLSRVSPEPLEWKFENVHIARAASELSRKIHLPLIIDARVVAPPDKEGPPSASYAVPLPTPPVPEDADRDAQYATDGIVREIKLVDVPLEAALKALTEPLNLTYAVKNNCIWITSPKRLAIQKFQYPSVPIDAQELGEALGKPINIEFEKQHVTRILDFVGESLKINFVVDQRALPEKEGGRQINPPYLTKVDNSYVPTGYVASIKLVGIPLRDTLNALLIPMGLTYRVDRNAIFVSSHELIETHADAVPAAAQTAKEDSALAKALDAPTNLEFENQHISGILKFIGDYLSVSFAVDFRAVKPVRISPSVAGQPGLPVFPPGTGAPLPAPPVAPTNVPLDPVIEAMYVTDGMVPYVKLVDVPMKDALNALLEPLNLAYEVRPNYIWITAKDRVGREDWSDPPVPASEQILVKKLNSPIALEFENQHIVTSLAFAAKYLKIAIKYDARAVPPLRDGVTCFEVKDGKPASTGLFPYVRLTEVPFKEVLKTLLIPMGLTYRVTQDAVIITSPELVQSTKPDEWADVPFLSEEKLEYSSAAAPPQGAPAPPQAAATSPGYVPAATNVKLVRIVKWSDGKYRAEIQSGLSGRTRYYKPGEAFEAYKLMSIDPEKNAVTIYSSASDSTFELQPAPSS